MTAVHLLNRSPTRALDDKTPYEAWHERKPTVGYLPVFRVLAFVKELNHVGKLNNRSSPRVFIGYAERAKAYHVFDPVTRRVRVARGVFDEGRGWAWDKMVDDGSATALRDFTVEYTWAPTTSPISPTTSTAPLRSPSPNLGELGNWSMAVGSSSAT